jgi:hypothetical protein
MEMLHTVLHTLLVCIHMKLLGDRVNFPMDSCFYLCEDLICKHFAPCLPINKSHRGYGQGRLLLATWWFDFTLLWSNNDPVCLNLFMTAWLVFLCVTVTSCKLRSHILDTFLAQPLSTGIVHGHFLLQCATIRGELTLQEMRATNWMVNTSRS